MRRLKLLEEDEKYLLPVYHRIPLIITDAKGPYLYDKSRKRYLDMAGGIAVNALGYRNRKILKAINRQSEKFLHLSNYFACEPVVEMAKTLCEHSFATKVFFANSGTEANEAAIKLVRKYGKTISPEKIEIVSLQNSFHGRTVGSLSLTGQLQKKQIFEPLLENVIHIRSDSLEELRNAVSENTCAIFLEYLQGEGGVIPISAEFIEEIKKLREMYGFLVVADEIQTGLFRCGSMFLYERFSLVPDIVTLAKSIGGGLPLGAMLVSKNLEAVFRHGDHGSTFGGNPLACAAGNAVLKVLLKTSFQEKLNKKATWFYRELRRLRRRFPTVIRSIRGIGMMIGIDTGDFATFIQKEALGKRIILNITNRSVIRLLPPLTISKRQLQRFLDELENIIVKMVGK